MRQTSQHNFARVPSVSIPRSKFDRSHQYKSTFNAGLLIPFYADEALPGDTFKMDATIFARLNTPIFPILDNMHLETFFFAVPNRLLWDDWEHFNGAQDDPGDSISFSIPQMVSPGDDAEVHSLSAYLGIPIQAGNITHSSLWHRAYNLIYNDWFRDQNLQDSIVVDTDAGPDTYADYIVRRRGKRLDYFTACLPSPQRGAAVTLPLGSVAPVVATTAGIPSFDAAGGLFTDNELEASTAIASPLWETIPAGGPTGQAVSWNVTGLEADLSGATAANINQIREAIAIQHLLERDARGGTRYTEIIRTQFGVVSDDARLQRPEYLGGGSQYVNVTPVTSSVENTNRNLGDLGAYGVSQGSGHRFMKSFTEHCTIIGLLSVRADLTYQQGLHRQFSRLTRYDYYWPAFQALGEQAVLRKELYATGTPATDDLVFGYQERHGEYRYYPSRITGEFNSAFTTSLDPWHLSQEFGTPPTLDTTFIQETPPMSRIVAVTTEPDFLLDVQLNLHCVRPMPAYGVPGLDRF